MLGLITGDTRSLDFRSYHGPRLLVKSWHRVPEPPYDLGDYLGLGFRIFHITDAELSPQCFAC